ncbi:MAG: GreA/GreB family elongation factor [Acidimicrobiales bacterium]
MAETVLSQAAYDRLKSELDDLTTRGRVEIARTIERARELGDLSENGDYHAAKDDQGKMEARIRQLQAMLDRAIIVESNPDASDGVVSPGLVVTIRYEGDEEGERYLFGSIEERRDDLSVISPGSPLGKALTGRRSGDTVSYEAPGGLLKVEILEVGN